MTKDKNTTQNTANLFLTADLHARQDNIDLVLRLIDILTEAYDNSIAEEKYIGIIGDLLDERDKVKASSLIKIRRKITEKAKEGYKFILIKGNHDSPDKDYTSSILEIFNGVENIQVILSNTSLKIVGRDILCIPYTEQKNWEAYPKTDLILGHLAIVGSYVSSIYQATLGFSLADLPFSSYGVFGHHHENQRIENRDFWYIGTPFPRTFGEVGQEKSYLQVDLNKWKFDFIPLTQFPHYYEYNIKTEVEWEKAKKEIKANPQNCYKIFSSIEIESDTNKLKSLVYNNNLLYIPISKKNELNDKVQESIKQLETTSKTGQIGKMLLAGLDIYTLEQQVDTDKKLKMKEYLEKFLSTYEATKASYFKFKPISIRLENFGSHKDSYLNFETGLNLITGDNGAGKSLFAEALLFALYGKTMRWGATNYNQLVRKGEKSFKITFRFELNDDYYEIVRGYPTLLEVRVNEVALNQLDLKNYFEGLINPEVLLLTTILCQNGKNVNYFLDLDEVSQRSVLDTILNVEILNSLVEYLQLDIKNTKEGVTLLEQQQLGLGIEHLEAFIADLKEKHKNFEQDKLEKVLRLGTELKEAEAQIKDRLEGLDKQILVYQNKKDLGKYKDLEDRIKKTTDKYTQVTSSISQIDILIEKIHSKEILLANIGLEKLISLLEASEEKNSNYSVLKEEELKRLDSEISLLEPKVLPLEKLSQEISELEGGKVELFGERNSIQKSIDTDKTRIDKYKANQEKGYTTCPECGQEADKNYYQDKIEKLNTELTEDISELEEIQKEIDRLEANLKQKKEEQKELLSIQSNLKLKQVERDKKTKEENPYTSLVLEQQKELEQAVEKQEVTSLEIQNLISERDGILSEYGIATLEGLKEIEAKYTQELKELNSLQSETYQIESQITLLKNQKEKEQQGIDLLKKELQSFKKTANPYSDMIITQERELDTKYSQSKEIGFKLKDTLFTLSVMEDLATLSGFKTKGGGFFRAICYSAVQDKLNEELMRYSLVMSDNKYYLQLRLVEEVKGEKIIKLSLKVKLVGMADSDELKWQSLSGGQIRRLNLACAFTFRDIASSIRGIDSNFILLDEVSYGLSEGGLNLLAQILVGLQTKIPSIYAISHDTRIQDVFERKYIVTNPTGIESELKILEGSGV